MEAIIKVCHNCSNDTGPAAQFQNKKYGQGVRVFTPSQKTGSEKRAPCCTVCGKRS